jgi:hypothetical protein
VVVCMPELAYEDVANAAIFAVKICLINICNLL